MAFIQAIEYVADSQERFFKALSGGVRQAVEMFFPYYNTSFHIQSLLYPFMQLLHALHSLLFVGKGLVMLLPALFNEPAYTLPQVIMGIGFHALSSMTYALGVLTTAVSVCTRSLMTAIRGYEKDRAQPQADEHRKSWDLGVHFFSSWRGTIEASEVKMALQNFHFSNNPAA